MSSLKARLNFLVNDANESYGSRNDDRNSILGAYTYHLQLT